MNARLFICMLNTHLKATCSDVLLHRPGLRLCGQRHHAGFCILSPWCGIIICPMRCYQCGPDTHGRDRLLLLKLLHIAKFFAIVEAANGLNVLWRLSLWSVSAPSTLDLSCASSHSGLCDVGLPLQASHQILFQHRHDFGYWHVQVLKLVRLGWGTYSKSLPLVVYHGNMGDYL